MGFIEEFIARGFFYQATNLTELQKLTDNQKTQFYIGFDPTASSLHVGNLLQLMILRLVQKHGHTPIILFGGGTVKVGDPSGKDEMRKMLDQQKISENLAGIKKCASKFIDFASNKAIIVNNDDWLSQINYLDFLGDYGRFFSINRMIKFDSVKTRLEREQNLSFLEFNYMLLQAYDFVWLNKNYNCRVQCGGSDQWGNIVCGVELNSKLNLPEVFGLTSPLITTASGAKMGKSVNGAVWLDQDLLSPYDYFQFWRNSDDQDVVKFLKLFTELSVEEIDQLKFSSAVEINNAKKLLAFEATKLCHGIVEAKKAAGKAAQIFESKQIVADLPTLVFDQLALHQGKSLYLILKDLQLCASGGEGKRLIKGGAVKINEQTILDESLVFNHDFAANEKFFKISVAKKKFGIIKIS